MIDHHDDPRAYIECSNDMHDVYKNIDEYIAYRKTDGLEVDCYVLLFLKGC